LQVLDRSLAKGRNRLQVVDVTAEPGMGKSRLLHELCQRIGGEQAFILSGNCSPDGQQTPFLPFIEVVRGSFQVSAKPRRTSRNRAGLPLGLQSPQNLGLLLNLLGLQPRRAACRLDGVLVGLRARAAAAAPRALPSRRS
jgi:predicted ATPase